MNFKSITTLSGSLLLLLHTTVFAMTTRLTHTVQPGGGGATFASLGACLAHLRTNHNDLISDDNILDVEIVGQWSSVDSTSAIVGNITTNTDATRYINIYTTGDARHAGVYSTSKYTLQIDTQSTQFEVGANYTRISGIQFLCVDGATDLSPIGFISLDGSNSILYNSIVKSTAFSSRFSNIAIDVQAVNVLVYNNIIYDFVVNTDVAISTNYSGSLLYNNTIYGGVIGIDGNSADPILINNVTRGCANGYINSAHATSDYNSSDVDGDAPNATKDHHASPWYSAATADSDIFVDAINRNLHLKAGCIFTREGYNLSSTFTDDIDFTTRGGQWDLGADQISGGGAMKAWYHRHRCRQ